MANYSLLVKLIADNRQFKTGFAQAGKTLQKHNANVKATGNSYNKLSQSLRKSNDLARNAALRYGTQSKAFKKAAMNARAYQNALHGVNRAMAKQGLGGASRGAGGLAGGVAGVAMRRIIPLVAIGAAGAAIKDVYGIITQFEQGLDEVQAITGATTPQMKALSDQAQELGAVTQRTARDVLQLQTELSKLGFTVTEIKAATKSIIQLSVATRSDLGEAAKITASVLRAFHISAYETGRVVDVMAKSFSSSALDMEKFKTGIAIVAPAAYVAGLSIEATTAALGLLANNGLDASMAGTSLRNIFLELSMKGLNLDMVLAKINDSTNKAGAAQEYFQKRSASAAIILAQNRNLLIELTGEVYKSKGAVDEMADTMSGNWLGSMKLVKSAWEGMVLSIADNTGPMTEAVNIALALLRLKLDDVAEGFRNATQSAEHTGLIKFKNEMYAIGNGIKEISSDYNDSIDAIIKANQDGNKGMVATDMEASELRKKNAKEEYDYKIKSLGDAIDKYEKLLEPVSGKMDDIASAEEHKLDWEKATYGDETIKDVEKDYISLTETIRLLKEQLRDLYLVNLKTQLKTTGGGGEAKIAEIETRIQSIQHSMLNMDMSWISDNSDIMRFASSLGIVEDLQQKIAATDLAIVKSKDIGEIEKYTIVLRDLKNTLTDVTGGFDNVRMTAEQFGAALTKTVEGGIESMIVSLAEGFGEALVTRDWSNYGKDMLLGVADFLVQLGSMAIAQGVLIGAINTAWASGPAGAAILIGAGIAAVAVGGMMKGLMNNPMSATGSTSGGGVGGTTAGEGYSRYAASGHTAGGYRGSSGEQGQVEFTISGTNLVGVLNNNKKKSNNFY